jgi:hypothetical protein
VALIVELDLGMMSQLYKGRRRSQYTFAWKNVWRKEKLVLQ